MFVDGGHDYSIAAQDLANFKPLAANEASVVIDDVYCTEYWCEGPTKAWKEGLRSGGIQQESRKTVNGGFHGWAIGRYVR